MNDRKKKNVLLFKQEQKQVFRASRGDDHRKFVPDCPADFIACFEFWFGFTPQVDTQYEIKMAVKKQSAIENRKSTIS